MKLVKYCLPLTGLFLLGYASLAAADRVIIIERPSHSTTTIAVPAPVSQEMDVYGIMAPIPPNAHYFWQLAGYGQIPRRAVVGGEENGSVLFICQAPYNGGIHPGKVVAGRCNITYGGNEITRDHFRVLVGEGLTWRTTRFGRIPANAVVGGFENGQPLYICHARYGFRGVHPGKVIAGACNIGYGGQEIRLEDYQILVS